MCTWAVVRQWCSKWSRFVELHMYFGMLDVVCLVWVVLSPCNPPRKVLHVHKTFSSWFMFFLYMMKLWSKRVSWMCNSQIEKYLWLHMVIDWAYPDIWPTTTHDNIRIYLPQVMRLFTLYRQSKNEARENYTDLTECVRIIQFVVSHILLCIFNNFIPHSTFILHQDLTHILAIT